MDIKTGGRIHGKTTALINEMKQQLADKDAEIARLKALLVENSKQENRYVEMVNKLQSSLAEAKKALKVFALWADRGDVIPLDEADSIVLPIRVEFLREAKQALKGADGQEKVL